MEIDIISYIRADDLNDMGLSDWWVIFVETRRPHREIAWIPDAAMPDRRPVIAVYKADHPYPVEDVTKALLWNMRRVKEIARGP